MSRYVLPQIDGFEAEAFNQSQHGPVVAIDKFAAPFADHALCPERGVRMHAPANAARCLVNGAGKTGILQGESGVQACDTRANDGNTHIPMKRVLPVALAHAFHS